MASSKNELWLKKAIAFVTRSRKEMWGKHNAEILAFLFDYGLANKTAAELLFGWNKRDKLRPAESWGLDKEDLSVKDGKLFFPEGIVVPYVLEKELKKITIVKYKDNLRDNENYFVEGGAHISMIFGESTLTGVETFVVENILDGFYLLQECGFTKKKEKICLIIPDDLSTPPDYAAKKRLKEAGQIFFLGKKDKKSCELWARDCKTFNFYNYQHRGDLNAYVHK